MTLRVEHISFFNFRSYETFDLGDIGPLTVLVGPNAVGKTNVVEGLQLLTALTSFRGATAEQLVRRGEAGARISTHVSDGRRELDIECLIEGTKKYRLNGKAKRPSDLKGLVPSVTFTPDDLEMVKGSMGVRRRMVDALGSQLNKNYHLIRKDYEKVVRHKNKLLKEDASAALLESINDMLVTCGAQLVCYRAALFCRLAEQMNLRYAEISGGREQLSSRYEYSWACLGAEEGAHAGFYEPADGGCSAFAASLSSYRADSLAQPEHAATVPGAEDALPGCSVPPSAPKLLGCSRPDEVVTPQEARAALAAALADRLPAERQRRRCLVGPHLDQMNFAIDGMDASRFASQGQQRSIVLAEKLAEAAVIEDMLGVKPLLLLDDVMSELDGARRAALVDYLSQDVQAFITTANLAYFDGAMLSRARVVRLPLDVAGEENGGL